MTARAVPTQMGVPLQSLAGIRVLPALLIFLAHALQYRVFRDDNLHLATTQIFNKVGYESVSFFIVLSGFIITWVASRQRVNGEFIARRFLKIVPSHVILWGICLVVLGWPGLLPAIANLVLVHGWVPNDSYFFSLNVPAWTLCVEVLFYGTFPLVLPWITRRSTKLLWILGTALATVVILLPWVLSIFPDGRTLSEPAFLTGADQVDVSQWKFWLVYLFPPIRLIECVIGAIVCTIFMRRSWPTVSPYLVAILTVLAIVYATLWAPFLVALTSLTLVPIVLIVAGIANAEWRLGRSHAWLSPVATLAPFTFSFYLVQWPIITVWTKYVRPADGYELWGALGALCMLFVVATSMAYSLHRLIERPVVHIARGFLGRRRARNRNPQTRST